MFKLSITLALMLLAASTWADLAGGTPLFICTPPTQNVDGSNIPETGPAALKEFRFYIDGGSTPQHITPDAALCEWQAQPGEIQPGNRVAQVTAVNNAGEESARTTPLPFVMPHPAPSPPTGLSVQ